ncbi:hypothetical protein PPL_04902 [Heterostelium album PN500]|uniref:Uncharacterized protein n=1 Tax=Heterostelium pallidum (strain ATCC 26659 / Pp 5 / PN500) TaxID=670386 RepID=D3B8V9_HETP5|nr:hypothetical protein PPL_04902 [Heterostelium album PN500]EFA82477.1 hypothetical protein PPL_04902 [Heterostelium album PN500]|eukprot:XP_020434594.1 hypothetical protein PPL_04902 [Heterostelium album PN500]
MCNLFAHSNRLGNRHSIRSISNNNQHTTKVIFSGSSKEKERCISTTTNTKSPYIKGICRSLRIIHRSTERERDRNDKDKNETKLIMR